MPPSTMAYMADLGRRGHPVTAIYMGDGDLPNHPGLMIQDYRGVFADADAPDDSSNDIPHDADAGDA